MKKIICIFNLILSLSIYSMDKTAEEIISEVDSVMVDEDSKYLVEMNVFRGDRQSDYDILIWNRDNSFVSKVREPLFDKGTVFLMKEDNTWIYYPKTKKTIRTNGKQNLLGSDFTFNEVAGISYSEGYDLEIIDRSKIDWTSITFTNSLLNKVKESGYIISCSVKDGQKMPYPKVLVYVVKINGKYYPVREEFYTKSKQLLGILIFDEIAELDGRTRPTKVVMRSNLNNDNYSIITYKRASYEANTPDIYFSEPYMSTLSKNK